MSSLQPIRELLAADLDKVDKAITEALDSSNNMMNEVIYDYMRHRGKQIRPILLLLVTALFHGNTAKAINSAAAVELLHNASLIHDDVVDESMARHGHPTINANYDSHIAVIVGDYFTSTALTMGLVDGDIRVPMALGNLGKALTIGELDQADMAMQHSLEQEDYMTVISHKTASLFVACAEMGCYASRVSLEDLEKMRRFAELFGRVFQIRDDIFDYTDNQALGKPTGQDLQEGKITLPLILALKSDSAESLKMRAIAEKAEKTPEEIQQLIDFTLRSDAIKQTYDIMHRMRDEAYEIIRNLGDVKTLMDLFDYIIARDC